MLYLTATAAPLVFSFLLLEWENEIQVTSFHAAGSSIFQLLSGYAVKDIWTGGLSCILITVSQRGKGSMDHMNVFFAFVNVLYEEHKKQTWQADTNPIYASR